MAGSPPNGSGITPPSLAPELLERELEKAASQVERKTRWVSVALLVSSTGTRSNLLAAWPDQPVFAIDRSIGLGVAAELRLDRLDARAANDWVEDLRSAGQPGPDGSLPWVNFGSFATPPIYCGAAFSPESTGRGRWSEFPTFAMLLPRWNHFSDGEASWLILTMRASEVLLRERRDQALAELRHILECLERPLGREPPRAAEPVQLPRVQWEFLVEDALAQIRSGRFKKLVLARTANVTAERDWDLAEIDRRLVGRGSRPFAVRFGAATFLGATPENLVAGGPGDGKEDPGGFETYAVAGTTLPGQEHELRGTKIQEEHRLVVEEIDRRFAGLGLPRREPAKRQQLWLRDVVHLETELSYPAGRGLSLIDVATALHPTPAVAGLPSEDAIDWIVAHEPEPRGWYAGFVGRLSLFDGFGHMAVAIRSGLVCGREATLYAGAGIVAGSDPADEYQETRWKQRPFLRALGLEAGLEA